MNILKRPAKVPEKWKILMVDDEPEVHRATKMVLGDFKYKNCGLEIYHAYSGLEAMKILNVNNDIALVLLDVVMEADDAGLKFIEYVRNILKNRIVQIVLKTGQAGRFPEKDVVAKYDINNFYSKTDLTADKITTMVTSALRGYELSSSLKTLNRALERELEKNKLAKRVLKQSKSEIRRLSQLQQNIIKSSDIWLYAKNNEGRFIVWNDAAETISGYKDYEVIDRTDVWDFLIPCREQRKRLLEEEASIIYNGKGPVSIDVTILDKKGREKILSWHLRPLKGASGETLGMSCLGVDKTEKRLLERKFFHSQKMEAVGRLAGGVAHDFNNALTAIRGYCELLQLKVGDNSDLTNNIIQIDTAAERAEKLTKQLLSFSRHQLVKTIAFDLNSLIEKMQEMLLRLVNKKTKISIELNSKKGLVKTNYGKIEQVLMSLVVNSSEAMPSGGVIKISTYDKVENNQEYIVLKVSDNGEGIPQAIQSEVFDPFFSTKSREKSSGLGLSTAYGIMKQCGGSIVLKSEENIGTDVILSFPALESNFEEKEKANKNKIKKVGVENSGINVLLVGDGEIAHDDTLELFNELGYGVECFSCADEVFKTGNGISKVDLLITDFLMEGMSGPEIFEKVRCCNRELKVIYITDYFDDAIPRKSDVHIFLEKPVAASKLIDAMDELLIVMGT